MSCHGSGGYSPARRPGFDSESVHVGFVVDKVVLGQGFPRLLRFSPVSFIPPVLQYAENENKLIIFITLLHNKPQGCGTFVASAAGPLKKSTPIYHDEFVARPRFVVTGGVSA